MSERYCQARRIGQPGRCARAFDHDGPHSFSDAEPTPDFRSLAGRLAEALGKHRDPWPCAIRAIAPDEQDSARFNFICGDCCNRGVSPVFKHTKKCCVSFDAALLAEAKGMMEEGWESRDI